MHKKTDKCCGEMGLTINDDKTVYVIICRGNLNCRLEQHIELERRTFRSISKFKYIGSNIVQDNNV